MCNIRRFYCLRELYETDFHKPGVYGSGRAWANAWGVFRRDLSRGGRGRSADVGFVVCHRWGGIFSCFFSTFFSSNAHGLLYQVSMRPRFASFTSLLVVRKADRAKRPRPFFAFRAKKPLQNEARPRERSDRGRFLLLGKKTSAYRGAYRVPLVCMCM